AVDVEHAAALGRILDGFLRLLLGADEDDAPAAGGEVAGEILSLGEQTDRLLEVDDVDPVALGEDVGAHLRVPALGLVSEVDPCLQQRLHTDSGGFGIGCGDQWSILPGVRASVPFIPTEDRIRGTPGSVRARVNLAADTADAQYSTGRFPPSIGCARPSR